MTCTVLLSHVVWRSVVCNTARHGWGCDARNLHATHDLQVDVIHLRGMCCTWAVVGRVPGFGGSGCGQQTGTRTRVQEAEGSV